MSVTGDPELFALFEDKDPFAKETLDTIIEKAIKIKKYVVEQDEKESGLRKVLNFGHTLGHGFEAAGLLQGSREDNQYHGEAVALGMLCMCSEEIRERLIKIYKKIGLPVHFDGDTGEVTKAVIHDKKAFGGKVSAVISESVGSFEFRDMDITELEERMRAVL